MQKVSRRERLRIEEGYKIERRWWGGVKPFYNDDELFDAVRRGVLVPVQDTFLYRISPNAPLRYNYLAPNALYLLRAISERWAWALLRRKIKAEHYLLVTSLVRTTEYQVELTARDYPTAEDSSHERGLAFDISFEWFEAHLPMGRMVLGQILMDANEEGYLNFIVEDCMQIFHVAVSPTFTAETKLE